MKQQINEIKRMQELAGMINENDQPGIYHDIEQDLFHGDFDSPEAQIEYLQDVIQFCQQKIDELNQQ